MDDVLARLQSDVLMVLTARHTGALLVTLDRHFVVLRHLVAFGLVILPPSVVRRGARAGK